MGILIKGGTINGRNQTDKAFEKTRRLSQYLDGSALKNGAPSKTSRSRVPVDIKKFQRMKEVLPKTR